MPNQATVQSGLTIRKVDGTTVILDYAARPSAFLTTVSGNKGPVPGAMTVTDTAAAIDISQLETPGLCRLMNQDPTNRISVNVTMELMPGESYVIRLNQDYGTLGTGSPSNLTDFTAETDPGVTANLLVEAFER